MSTSLQHPPICRVTGRTVGGGRLTEQWTSSLLRLFVWAVTLYIGMYCFAPRWGILGNDVINFGGLQSPNHPFHDGIFGGRGSTWSDHCLVLSVTAQLSHKGKNTLNVEKWRMFSSIIQNLLIYQIWDTAFLRAAGEIIPSLIFFMVPLLLMEEGDSQKKWKFAKMSGHCSKENIFFRGCSLRPCCKTWLMWPWRVEMRSSAC